jgi:hypothetical protein
MISKNRRTYNIQVRMKVEKKTCMDNSRTLRKRRTYFNKHVRINV